MADESTGRLRVPVDQADAEPIEARDRSDRPPDLVFDSVVSEPLRAIMTANPQQRVGVVVELRAAGGVQDSRVRFNALLEEVTHGRERIDAERSSPYATVALDPTEVAALAQRDGERRSAEAAPATSTSNPAPRGCVYRMWPNFEIGGMIIRSSEATKCRAAQRTFDAQGKGIVWAVLDSGIDRHVHFEAHSNLDLPEGLEHRSFLDEPSDPLSDGNGHGTHVAGIIAGGLGPLDHQTAVGWYRDARGSERRQSLPVTGISGMAPQATLLSCQVLRPDRTGDVTALLEALLYVQEVNDYGRTLRVHGVNISVGHVFDPRWFAAGRTPVCQEVDRLVKTGVVVVVAAGNSGYGYAKDPNGRTMRLGFDMTINDPGNAELGITVGATSSSPHTTGVSYFSSKGPTGDGRLKPDLVAPGERVISAAAGKLRDQAQQADPQAQYIESSGTSMAAPHVSGAAAGLLSVKREFIGQPERVKEVMMASATDLRRDRAFQGSGMLDALRALQSL